MSFSTRFFLTFVLAVAVPAMALAAVPGNVTNIQATLQGGKVLVTWNPASGDDIQSYRVFYSHASILNENGIYDDYDTVEGTVNSFTIQNTPASGTLYVSVLAVNASGEESPYFAEEASVNLGSGQTGTTTTNVSSTPVQIDVGGLSSASPVATNTTTDSTSAQTLRLISVQALSATGVQLTFSTNVTVDPAVAANAFSVKTGSGKALILTRLVIKGNTVTLNTVPQERGVVYAVSVNTGVTGKDANGASVPLDMDQTPMLFTGHPSGIAPVNTPATGGTVSGGTDITNLRVHAQAETKRGLYTVETTWDRASGDIASYQVFQTTDNGATYGQPSTVAKDANGVTVAHVPAGHYGVFVRILFTDGSVSRGVLQTIDLPGTAPTGGTQGNVLGNGGTPGNLPQSGPGLLLALLLTGSLVGFSSMRKLRSIRA